jgi:hypothetical protein
MDIPNLVETAVIGGFGLYLQHVNNRHFATQNRIMVEQGGTAMPTSPLAAQRPPRWPIVVMLVALVCAWIPTASSYWNSRSVPENSGPRAVDPARLEAFKNALATYPSPGSNLHIVGVGKSACRIAMDYKDILASAGWITERSDCVQIPINLLILTQSAIHSPAQASELRRALEDAGLKVGWLYDPSLAPDQFTLVVGHERE